MQNHKLLNIHRPDPPLQDKLSKELKISKILSQLLINRGISELPEAEKFLNVKLEDLLPPFSFRDMKKAVAILENASGGRKKVLICGDYDVDGITAVALLKETFRKTGIDALHYIPHRIKDGYGLNKDILRIVKERKVDVVLTADCGISGFDIIKELRSSNVDVILTDHHEPAGDDLPQASAIINPKIRNCPYKFKELAGVGVAYKLCQALTGERLVKDLDLVCLGTVADVVPLIGENRIIVKEGLTGLSRAGRIGIKALIEVSRIENRPINATFVSFILGPRINASGRMDNAEVSLNLLISRDKEEADVLAKTIDAHNRQRQKIENKIIEEAHDLISREVNFKDHKVIVIAKEGWHQGVLGIVASKLADKFYRPTIVISLGQDYCKGSGRSIRNFHLFHALLECREFLTNFGGHSHAVGLTVDKDKIKDFRDKINQLAHQKLQLQDLLPSIDVDMELKLSDINENLANEFEVLQPFGAANPEPLFFTRNLAVRGKPLTLGRDTLKFWVTDGCVNIVTIAFGMAGFLDSLLSAKSIDLVYHPRIDSWQGHNSVILEIKEIFVH